MRTQTKIKKKTWKEKAKDRCAKVRHLEREKKRQHERAEKWRSRYYELKRSTRPQAVKNHSYPLEFMWLAVWMHISYNVSLRGVSQSLCKIGELYEMAIDYISPSSIRNWCLKFGMYCLLQPIKEGDYALILDESIEIGKEHLLVLLVVPLDQSSPINSLCLQDVKVLDLGVQTSWNSKQVAKLIKDKKELYGINLLYGISDKDSMLRKTLTMCNLIWIGDCTHEMANRTKALFRGDEEFNGFIKQLNALRAKWILSKHNLYVPPALRSKSRFHQLFIVHKWGQFILDNWGQLPQTAKVELGFVKKAHQLIKMMADFHHLIEGFSKIFKSRGIQNKSIAQWKILVKEYKEDRNNQIEEKIELFISQMNNYLNDQCVKLNTTTQILCCSDIIESTFGKYKNKGGMKIITDDALYIAAYPEKKELADVKKAMQSIKIVELLKWKKKNTTVSKLALIKRRKNKKEKSAA